MFRLPRTTIPLALFGLAFSTGCGGSDEPPDPAWAKVRKELREAVSATKDLASKKADEFLQALEQDLEKVDEKIAQARKDLEGARESTRERLAESLRYWQTKRDALGEKIQEWKSSSKDAWAELRPGLEQAWNDLRDASRRAAEQFTDGESKP